MAETAPNRTARKRGQSKPAGLDLRLLAKGIKPGVTPASGAFMGEAAAVCLADSGHKPGVELRVEGVLEARYPLHFIRPTATARRSHGDPEVATEYGAYALAIMATSVATGLTVVERARKGGGFDFWLGDREDPLPFQRKARLEVSGIRSGSSSDLARRTRQKLEQTEQSIDLGLVAYVAVAEFSEPALRLVLRALGDVVPR